MSNSHRYFDHPRGAMLIQVFLFGISLSKSFCHNRYLNCDVGLGDYMRWSASLLSVMRSCSLWQGVDAAKAIAHCVLLYEIEWQERSYITFLFLEKCEFHTLICVFLVMIYALTNAVGWWNSVIVLPLTLKLNVGTRGHTETLSALHNTLFLSLFSFPFFFLVYV